MTDFEKFTGQQGKHVKITDPSIARIFGKTGIIKGVGHSARAGHCIVETDTGESGWIQNDNIQRVNQH